MKSYSRFSNAQRVEIDGIKFASKAEGALYLHLKTLHTKLYLQPKTYLSKAQILYKPDFFCEGIYYEMKGRESRDWRLKRRLWKHYGPGELHVYKMKGQLPCFFEKIIPEAGDE